VFEYFLVCSLSLNFNRFSIVIFISSVSVSISVSISVSVSSFSLCSLFFGVFVFSLYFISLVVVNLIYDSWINCFGRIFYGFRVFYSFNFQFIVFLSRVSPCGSRVRILSIQTGLDRFLGLVLTSVRLGFVV